MNSAWNLNLIGQISFCMMPPTASCPEMPTTENQLKTDNELFKDDLFKKKIMILGGGPNRIGQGIEFDYCCCHASYQAANSGYKTIMVNSNPETVSGLQLTIIDSYPSSCIAKEA